jgi:hypothetical protein
MLEIDLLLLEDAMIEPQRNVRLLHTTGMAAGVLLLCAILVLLATAPPSEVGAMIGELGVP